MVPSLCVIELVVWQLTSMFVARNGRSYLSGHQHSRNCHTLNHTSQAIPGHAGLTAREQRNPQFDFLKPTHPLFGLLSFSPSLSFAPDPSHMFTRTQFMLVYVCLVVCISSCFFYITGFFQQLVDAYAQIIIPPKALVIQCNVVVRIPRRNRTHRGTH